MTPSTTPDKERRRLLGVYPGLAWLLGREGFARLTALATAAPDPGAELARLLVREPLPPGIPARLAADLEALERAMAQVAALPGPQRLAPEGRVERPRRLPCPGWEALVLTPMEALRIVPLAFRLDAYLRQVLAGRRPRPPRRSNQTVVVYRARDRVLRLALSAAEGRVLSALTLGLSLGQALDEEQGLDQDQILGLIWSWICEGLFLRVAAGGSPMPEVG